MSRNTPEGDIKQEIMKYLRTLDAVVEPLYTGMARAPGGRYRTAKTSLGRPDIFMLLDGRAIALEVKADTGQRPSQEIWQKRWESQGGLYWIVKSVDDVKVHLTWDLPI